MIDWITFPDLGRKAQMQEILKGILNRLGICSSAASMCTHVSITSSESCTSKEEEGQFKIVVFSFHACGDHALSHLGCEVARVQSLLQEFGESSNPIAPTIHCENVGAACPSADLVFHSRLEKLTSTSLEIILRKGSLRVPRASTSDQLAEATTEVVISMMTPLSITIEGRSLPWILFLSGGGCIRWRDRKRHWPNGERHSLREASISSS